jgi:RNA polymerase sigma-70 factor (ECF subfamily)
MQAVQALERIAAALAGLADKPREAFVLHYLDGMTHAAIAAQLGVSTRMVQKYLVQALLRCDELAQA